MTKKYFFVKGENPETKSKFVSICTNVDFIDVCKMYRSKGLYVYSITILCQAKADEPICINSINYNSTINDRQYITNYMIHHTNISTSKINNIINHNIPILETDKIDLPIQTYHVRKDFTINIFPNITSINGKIKNVKFSKSLVLVKSDYNQDKVYIRISDKDKDYLTITFIR